MAEIQNERDLILLATVPRIIPVLIPIDRVEGLPGRLDGIDGDIEALGIEVNSVLGNTQDISIRVTNLTVTNSTSTALTVVRKNGITGTVTWSIFAGNGTLQGSGDSRSIAGNTITSASVTVRASIGGKEAFATINKLGAISTQNTVDLTTQVTGQLANSNVSGLGALALLNTVNLNTQTTGALNGQTQVTNLGDLAYANSIAANQIGAGTLAAGVIYAGTISADKVTAGTLDSGVIYAGTISADKVTAGSFTGKEFTGGTFTGGTFRTKVHNAFPRVEISAQSNSIRIFNSYEEESVKLSAIATGGVLLKAYSFSEALRIDKGVSNSDSANGISVDVPGYAITVNSPLAPLHIIPKSSFPSQIPSAGTLFVHIAHGLCISDGTKWLKTAWTDV